MKELISGVFKLLDVGFDKLPFMTKIKGYRTVLGLVGLAVATVLAKIGVGPEWLHQSLEIGFTAWTALALNSKVNS